jgi:uncharacterized protein Usg
MDVDEEKMGSYIEVSAAKYEESRLCHHIDDTRRLSRLWLRQRFDLFLDIHMLRGFLPDLWKMTLLHPMRISEIDVVLTHEP